MLEVPSGRFDRLHLDGDEGFKITEELQAVVSRVSNSDEIERSLTKDC